jgi:hypothetical protein
VCARVAGVCVCVCACVCVFVCVAGDPTNVSSYYYTCVFILLCVLILLYTCRGNAS